MPYFSIVIYDKGTSIYVFQYIAKITAPNEPNYMGGLFNVFF